MTTMNAILNNGLSGLLKIVNTFILTNLHEEKRENLQVIF